MGKTVNQLNGASIVVIGNTTTGSLAAPASSGDIAEPGYYEAASVALDELRELVPSCAPDAP